MDNKETVARILLICSTCQGKLVIFFIYTTKEKLVKEKLVKENLLVCTVGKFSLRSGLVKENCSCKWGFNMYHLEVVKKDAMKQIM